MSLFQAQQIESFSKKAQWNDGISYQDFSEIRNIKKEEFAKAKKVLEDEVAAAKKMIESPDTKVAGEAKLAEWQPRLDALTSLEEKWKAGTLKIEKAKEEGYEKIVAETQAKLKELFGEVKQTTRLAPVDTAQAVASSAVVTAPAATAPAAPAITASIDKSTADTIDKFAQQLAKSEAVTTSQVRRNANKIGELLKKAPKANDVKPALENFNDLKNKTVDFQAMLGVPADGFVGRVTINKLLEKAGVNSKDFLKEEKAVAKPQSNTPTADATVTTQAVRPGDTQPKWAEKTNDGKVMKADRPEDKKTSSVIKIQKTEGKKPNENLFEGTLADTGQGMVAHRPDTTAAKPANTPTAPATERVWGRGGYRDVPVSATKPAGSDMESQASDTDATWYFAA